MLTLIKKTLGKKRYLADGRRRKFFSPFRLNDTSAFRPEIWANEGVRLLWEQMVWAGIVHRDFDKEIANFGQTVHTRKVGTYTALRKQNDLDTVTEQDSTATNIEVKLNQRVYTTFIIGDGERSKSFKDLFQLYLEPAMAGNARMLDQVVAGQCMQFLANRTGGLGQLSAANAHDYLIDARGVMNGNRVADAGRWMGLASPSETLMQKADLFKSAERKGDGGLALREALLGRVAGFNNFLSLNTPSPRGATMGTTTTLTAADSAGATVIDVASAAVTLSGVYLTIDGDYTPLRVSSVNVLELTLNRPLLRAVASGAVVRPVSTGLINQASAVSAGDDTLAQASGYPVGWAKEIVVDGTGVPVVGQLVAFKAAAGTVHAPEYTIIQVKSSGTQIVLDRPLESSVLDNDIVCYGPNGDYNFACQREAIALVNRPLALPVSGTGVLADSATFNNMSLRVTIAYDSQKQGTRVTVDGLFGVKVLEALKGCVMFG